MRQLLRQHRYTLLVAMVLFVLAVPFLHRVDDWGHVYLPAARAMRAGANIYDTVVGYVYPPLMAFLAVPFTFASPLAGRAAWYLVNAVCVVLLWRWSWRLSGGGTLQGTQGIDRREHVVLLLGMLVSLRFVTDCLDHQQTDLLVGAFLLGGGTALLRARSTTAALCFGLAAGIKVTALLWVLYFLWRRRWLAALVIVAVATGINLVPDLCMRAPEGRWWLSIWLGRFIVPIATGAHPLGLWYSAPIYNQSFAGTALRVLVLSRFGDEPRPGALPVGLFKAIVYGVEAGMLLVTFAAMRRSRDRASASNVGCIALEASAVFMLMVLLSPGSSKAHFVTTILPALALGRLAVFKRDAIAGVFLGLAMIASLISNRSLMGSHIGDITQWYGGITWCAVALLGGCVWALWYGGSRSADMAQN